MPHYVFNHGGYFGSIQVHGADGGPIAGWHVVTFAGLILLAAAGALLRHERSARVGLLALAGSGALVTAAVSGPTIVS